MSGLPKLTNGDHIGKTVQVKFRGYDHNEGAGNGSLWDMENLTGDNTPLLSTRKPRYLLRTLTQPGGLYGRDCLYWVDGGGFYQDGVKKGDVTPGEKLFVSLGDYLLIFPDKAFYHTETGAFGNLEASWNGTASISDGTYAGVEAVGNTIKTTGEPFPFSPGDAVHISGGPEGTEKTAVIREESQDKRELRFYENTFSENDWTGTLSLKREAPDMDFLCENENRLWGCKGSTIYASRLGDPFNWNVFDGLATDSYAVEVGSPGEFTGCCAYLGYPVFFKEDHIYKVYGSKPSNFQVMGSASLGVEKGGAKSLAIAGERLFYLSRAGVVSYGGGMPENISGPLGNVRYRKGVGGSDGEKYYLSLENGREERSLFVFDTGCGLWHREDQADVLGFAFTGELYFLTRSGELWLGGNPREIPQGAVKEGQLQSFAEFGDFVEDSPYGKGLSRLQLRLKLGKGARLTVKLQFDSEGVWKTAAVLEAEKKRSFVVPVLPRRCDHWRLRLEGVGDWKLFSLSREYYGGSDLNLSFASENE